MNQRALCLEWEPWVLGMTPTLPSTSSGKEFPWALDSTSTQKGWLNDQKLLPARTFLIQWVQKSWSVNLDLVLAERPSFCIRQGAGWCSEGNWLDYSVLFSSSQMWPDILWKTSEYSALSTPGVYLRCSWHSDTSKDFPFLITWSFRAESPQGPQHVLGYVAGRYGLCDTHTGTAITSNMHSEWWYSYYRSVISSDFHKLPPLPYKLGNTGW